MSEEKYDVLDEQGDKTGLALPKSEVHEKELMHASVFIWIYNDKGEVLLQYRAANKRSYPNVWDVSVAGHISAGDEPLTTAVREMQEEIGISVQPNELTFVERVKTVAPWLPDKKHPEFCWVYILHKELDPQLLSIQLEELTAIKLEPIQEIQAARKLAGSEKIYAARDSRIYDVPFKEIQKRITEGYDRSGT